MATDRGWILRVPFYSIRADLFKESILGPEFPHLGARVSHNGRHKVTFTSVNYFVLCLVALVVEHQTLVVWKTALACKRVL
jgi:hypothetical protein